MNKFLLSIVGYVFVMGLSIMVMINGWGLEVKSCGWVIGGGLLTTFIGALFSSAE